MALSGAGASSSASTSAGSSGNGAGLAGARASGSAAAPGSSRRSSGRNRCPGDSTKVVVSSPSALAIGLHRAVEGEELRVLAERVGVDLDRLGIALAAQDLRLASRLGQEHGALALGRGADPLGLLGALRAELLRLALALGLHPGDRSPGCSPPAGRRGGCARRSPRCRTTWPRCLHLIADLAHDPRAFRPTAAAEQRHIAEHVAQLTRPGWS